MPPKAKAPRSVRRALRFALRKPLSRLQMKSQLSFWGRPARMPDRRFRLPPERISTSNIPLTSCFDAFRELLEFAFLTSPSAASWKRTTPQLCSTGYETFVSISGLLPPPCLRASPVYGYIFTETFSFVYLFPLYGNTAPLTNVSFFQSNEFVLDTCPAPSVLQTHSLQEWASKWWYIAFSLRQRASFSLQSGCVTRVRIPSIFKNNPRRLVAPP